MVQKGGCVLSCETGGGPVVCSIGVNFAAASLYGSTVLVRHRRSGDLIGDSFSVFPPDRLQREKAIATRIKKRQSLTCFSVGSSPLQSRFSLKEFHENNPSVAS